MRVFIQMLFLIGPLHLIGVWFGEDKEQTPEEV